MTKTQSGRVDFAGFASLFEYPHDDFRKRVLDLMETPGSRRRQVRDLLAAFLNETQDWTTSSLQEHFNAMFSLTPVCAPYLSVHLFGDQSFKRSRLMTALEERYQQVGFERGSELPDHLSVVLKFTPGLTAEEWSELATFCLLPALSTMKQILDESGSPYRLLADASIKLVTEETGADLVILEAEHA